MLIGSILNGYFFYIKLELRAGQSGLKLTRKLGLITVGIEGCPWAMLNFKDDGFQSYGEFWCEVHPKVLALCQCSLLSPWNNAWFYCLKDL